MSREDLELEIMGKPFKEMNMEERREFIFKLKQRQISIPLKNKTSQPISSERKGCGCGRKK